MKGIECETEIMKEKKMERRKGSKGQAMSAGTEQVCVRLFP